MIALEKKRAGMMAGKAKGAAVAAACMLAFGSAAQAQMLGAVTSEELESVLAAAGLQPEMLSDAASGAPVAFGLAGEIKFWVRALDCAGAPPACENLVFFANFDLGRGVETKDYRIINDYNESQVFGRAYIIEGQGPGGTDQVGIDYVIELGGGVSNDHLVRNISRWTDVIGAFIDKFRAGRADS